MERTNHQTEQERQRWHAPQDELVERIRRALPDDGVIQSLKGLHLGRLSVAHQKLYSILEPSLCVIAQGSKEVLLGDQRYQYVPFHSFSQRSNYDVSLRYAVRAR